MNRAASTHQPLSEPMQLINPPTNEVTNQNKLQSPNQPVNQPINRPINEPHQPVRKSDDRFGVLIITPYCPYKPGQRGINYCLVQPTAQ